MDRVPLKCLRPARQVTAPNATVEICDLAARGTSSCHARAGFAPARRKWCSCAPSTLSIAAERGIAGSYALRLRQEPFVGERSKARKFIILSETRNRQVAMMEKHPPIRTPQVVVTASALKAPQ